MPSSASSDPGPAASRRAAGYLALGFLASLMPMPYNLVAVLPLVAAVRASVVALRHRRLDAPRSERVWSGIGLGLTLVLLTTVALPYAFYGVARDYHDCMVGANTRTAQADCELRLSRDRGLVRLVSPQG